MSNYAMSLTPEMTLEKASYPGQNPNHKIFRAGYKDEFESLPNITMDTDPDKEVLYVEYKMQKIAKKIKKDNWLKPVKSLDFRRTIIGIEDPTEEQEGKELVVAEWGKGFKSPVHGHGEGLLSEHLISGKMRVNTYKIVDLENKIVRPSGMEIFEGNSTIVSTFTPPGTHVMHKRESYVHNFEALEYSASLHIVPEHTRDGRDNRFTVEHFQLSLDDVVQISSLQAMYLPIGAVALVRSLNVPDYGDHFIKITGRPVQKAHGLRPQDKEYPSGENATVILDSCPMKNGTILLQLKPEAQKRFLDFVC